MRFRGIASATHHCIAVQIRTLQGCDAGHADWLQQRPRCRTCCEVHPLPSVSGSHLVFIVAQALAGLVVARALSHIHLACAGGEAVLRRGTHSAVVAGRAGVAARGSKVRQPCYYL